MDYSKELHRQRMFMVYSHKILSANANLPRKKFQITKEKLAGWMAMLNSHPTLGGVSHCDQDF